MPVVAEAKPLPKEEPKQVEAVVTPEPVKPPEPTPQPETPLTDHEQLMQAAGIQQSDWSAANYIISHESAWRPTATNSEGCLGLGQRCPASTLYAACPDLDPVCQLKHFTQYAVSRYGSWQGAMSTWQKQSWW